MNKIKLAIASASALVAGLVSVASAHAAALFTVPTSTATDLTANVSSQLSDVGFLAVLTLAGGIVLAFYVAGRLLGFIPGHRGARRS